MKKSIFILFIFLSYFSYDSLGNYFTIITDKSSYKHTDTLSYSVFNQLSACHMAQPTAYVYIHNAAHAIVSRQALQLNQETTTISIPLSGFNNGFYFISVFGYAAGKNSKLDGNTVCIAIDLPDSVTQQLDNRKVDLLPADGKALINFTNRMIVTLQSWGGNPVNDKLSFRNRQQQLIAVCQTNRFGWGAVDLPVVPDDSIWITDTKNKLLSVIPVENNRLFSNNGFSIHLPPYNDTMIVQVRKGDEATGHKVYLEVYEKEHAIAELPARFLNDTTVINILLPGGDFSNKLLKVLLKNEKAEIIAERYVYNENKDQHGSTGLFCHAISAAAPFYLETGSPAINDGLIAFEPEYLDPMNNLAEEGFRLAFSHPDYSNTQIDYYLYNSRNDIIQAGSSFADSTGQIRINGCDFYDRGYIKFYVNKNEVDGFEEVLRRMDPEELKKINARFSQIKNIDIRRTIIPSAAQPAAVTNFKTLENINLNVIVKNRIPELEKKYISNGLFRDHNSIQVNVEDDLLALNYSVTEYLVRKIPGLFIYNGDLRYRNGYVEIYIDEMYMSNILLNQFIQTNDIGYIKFFRNPISSGLQASGLGSAANGNSYAGGIQGSLAIYTRKSATINNNQSFRNGLLVKGYANEKAPPEE